MISLCILAACNSDEESSVISQHLQAHQSEIVSIEIEANQELILRTNQSIQFQAYGLLADDSRLQTEEDIDGNTSDQTINNLVIWSVDDELQAQVSNAGSLSGGETAGSVTVFASFAGSEASADVIITDAELAEIIVDTSVTNVEACRNLELTAIGVLSDGNEISLENEDITWIAEDIDDNDQVGEFKDETIGNLSTFLRGSVVVKAQGSSGEITSLPVSITVTGGLESISLSNTTDNVLSVGESIEIMVTGHYPDGEFDISANSTLISRDEELATFVDNILTAKTEVGVVEITGSCDSLVDQLDISVLNASQ